MARDFDEEMAAAGRTVHTWSNGPGFTYETHAHHYRKELCCLEGSIRFSTVEWDIELAEGDRLVIESGVEHSAVVGPAGVRCAEAHG